MNRRGFLMCSAASIAASQAHVGWAAGLQTQLVTLVLTDLRRGVSIPHLEALCAELLAADLPFTCVLDPATGQEPGLKAFIADLVAKAPGVDLVAHAPDLNGLSGYFQSRHLQQQTAALRTWGTAEAQVVACMDLPKPTAPTGVRSAGVTLVLIEPARSAPVTSQTWPNGVIRFFGGTRLDLGARRFDLPKPDRAETQAFYYLSAATLAGQPVAVVAERMRAFASALRADEATGLSAVQRVADLPLRDSYGFQRFVALHLVRPEPSDKSGLAGYEAFLADLRAEGLVVSEGGLGGGFEPDRPFDYWAPLAGSDEVLAKVTRRARAGIVSTAQEPDRALAPGHSFAFGAVAGFDAQGVLWCPRIAIDSLAAATADLSAALRAPRDVVISVAPGALRPAFARHALLKQLRQLARDGVTEFVPLHRLVQIIAPRGAEIERQRRTMAALPEVRAPHARQATWHQALMEDAKIAWRYIEQNTVRETGLCPATINFSRSDGWVHETVTMWDVGSHINGLIAALDLGLLEQRDFERSVALLLRQIRGRESQGRLLPQGWIRVDRQKWGNADFDGSDAGRLLSALMNLERRTGMTDELRALVGSWDLDQIVIDGEVHSVTEGKLTSVHRSHSAHYAARAFRHWGIEVASPYEVAPGFSSYDDEMALLEVVSWIGPLGAEPLLLEALEQGMSAESDYLADVLFAAQLEDHRETGRFIAVSEGPIDVSPWFTYQGLQLDALERTWALDTVGYEPQYADPVFWRENLVVSSKAAFLWAAMRPHPYSDALLEFVRAKARTENGFASSIFSLSGRATQSYSDLNTNAIILQAIAHMMRAA
ncbi:MAG: DUF3131 domain-containing protein [Pseudomonadota bacterium]